MSTSVIELIFNLFVHLCILWWFLTAFFFLYVRHIESQKIYAQLDGYIGEQVHNVMQRMQSRYRSEVSTDVEYQLILDRLSDDDIASIDRVLETSMEADVNLRNERVLTRAIAIGIAFTGTVLFYYAWFRESISLTDILVENLLVFSMIGGFEYLFFTRYGLHYEPVAPDELLSVVREYKIKRGTVA